jgi:hypothetical protein
MHGDIEAMTLPELADRLEDLDGRRTPVGWTPEDAQERATVERCILSMISEDGATSEVLRSPLDILLRNKEKTVRAVVRDFGAGGIRINVEGEWLPGTHVEMIVRGDSSDEHGLRVRGVIRRYERGVAHISVAEQPSEAHERRLRRFVLELIRHRVHN